MFLEDPTQRMTLDEVLQIEKTEGLKTNQLSRINFKVNESAFWLKVKIRNHSSYEQWMLECSYPNIDFIQMHYQEETGVWQSSKVIGDMVPFKDREVKHRYAVLPISIPEGAELDLYTGYRPPGYATCRCRWCAAMCCLVK